MAAQTTDWQLNAPGPVMAWGVSVSRGDVEPTLSGLLGRSFRGLGRDAFKPFLTPFGAQEYASSDAEDHAQQQQTDENPEPAASLALRWRSKAGHPPVIVRGVQRWSLARRHRRSSGLGGDVRSLREGPRLFAESCSAVAAEHVLILVLVSALLAPFHVFLSLLTDPDATREASRVTAKASLGIAS